MGNAPDNTLERALASLTLADVWELAPMAGPAPLKDGVVKSPFRPGERTGSFSVTLGMTRFVDFGDRQTKGGVWQFVKFARPDWEKRDIAKYLVEAAGLEWRDKAGAPMGAADRVALRQKRQAEAAEARERVYRDRRREAVAVPEAVEAVAWPRFVAERYGEGNAHFWAHPPKMEALAAKRGWPVEWVHYLVEAGLLSYPLESGLDEGGTKSRRHVAFRVDFPAVEAGRLELVPVGYHQKTFWPATEARPERRGWEFVPHVPRNAWSGFQRQLVELGRSRGVEGPGSPVIRPFPFLLGNPSHMELLIITEGQWDAASICGAMGGFWDTFNLPIVVAGVRGVSGDGRLFESLGPWLRKSKPKIWVLADNDRAARRWYVPREEPGKIPGVTMVERLRGLGASVKVSLLKDGRGGKDFNDYYKERRPGTGDVLRWMEKLGVLPK
jgi:hypothetical protein